MSANRRKIFGRLARSGSGRWGSVRAAPPAAILAVTAATAFFSIAPADAHTIEYLLSPQSRVRQRCTDCKPGDRADRRLRGTFDLTVLPIPDAYAIEAVTAIHWYGEGIAISGAGFFQRQGRNRISLVVDAVVNGKAVLLTSSAHPIHGQGGVHIALTSPPDSAIALEIELVARPNATDSPDLDSDGIPDGLDLCPRNPDSQQFDSDRDGVGDACDGCIQTPLGVATLATGCSPDQACPCAGPRPGVAWKDQRAYVTCIARSVKVLANADQLSRTQVKELVRKAVRSGCGRPVIALR